MPAECCVRRGSGRASNRSQASERAHAHDKGTRDERDERTRGVADLHGVPHIFADNREVLAFAYGVASGRDHIALILRLVGLGRGRASEYWGESWRGLDVAAWSLEIPQYSRIIYEAQDARTSCLARQPRSHRPRLTPPAGPCRAGHWPFACPSQ